MGGSSTTTVPVVPTLSFSVVITCRALVMISCVQLDLKPTKIANHSNSLNVLWEHLKRMVSPGEKLQVVFRPYP